MMYGADQLTLHVWCKKFDLLIKTTRLKGRKRKLEPVENVELLHEELDAGGHEQVGQVVAIDLITRSGNNYHFYFQNQW